MYICLSLLFFFMGSTAKKQGDFGIFTACTTKNKSLRLDCYYANCPDSPSFKCTFMTSSGVVISNATDDNCKLTLPDEGPLYTKKVKNYNCTLKRKERTEHKQISVDFSIRHGKKRIKPCPDTTGLLLHQAPTSLWPVVILSLWRVLVTDSQTT
ncbi:uncharacterized protein LOC130168120 isoform X2 [Seriola aureovittata]|uniref:uncharacterized protein LOC130168120 isoform X2 n=1 Tax=Seriola aureovittata TaxID=2871759 RepID=UPI0024BD9ACB|nr:uncharacterized protein LOC130168120 isoform X2 [Seriola aureovittata]